MMLVTKGATDVTTYFHLRLAADGTDATGLTITNFDLQYVRSGATPAAKVDATALGAANSAHSDNTAIEVDATDQPGVYRVDWPDAAFATGVDEVILTVKVATAFTESLRVRLLSATRGLAGTALPDAAADAAGGLPISDAGGLDLDAQIGADIDAILVDTAEIGAAGAGLTNINLPNQTMDIVGNITGNLSGSVGSVTGAVGSVTAGVTLANDAITAAKFDETTAWPLTAADTGATAVARTGADSDTLETLSDQLDTKASQSSVDDLPTNAELATSQAAADDATLAAIAALNNLSAAQVNAEVDAAIETYHLDHLLAVAYDPASKPGAADALLNELVESDAGVARYTANALEQGPGGGSAPTAAEIADAVWDEDLTGHTTTDSAGDILGNVATGTPPTAAAIRAEIDANSTQLAAIVADTNELQTDWVNGGRLDLILDARASQASVDDLPTNAELATSQAAADDATLAAIAALNNLSAGQVRTELSTELGRIDAAVSTRSTLTAAQVRTELGTELGRIDAAVSTRATPAQVATELGTYDAPTKAEVDAAVALLATAANLAAAKTVVDAIKLKTDLIPTDPAETSDIPSAATVAAAVLSAAALAPIAANAKKINDTTLTGDGSATPWGPA